MAGLQDDAVGSNLETGIKQSLDGLDHRRDQVGTTTDRFGQDHVRTLVLTQSLNRAHQLVKVAAETRSSYLAHFETLGPKRVGIDQIARLVIRHHANVLTQFREVPCQTTNQRGLAGSEEAADHDEADGVAGVHRRVLEGAACLEMCKLRQPSAHGANRPS